MEQQNQNAKCNIGRVLQNISFPSQDSVGTSYERSNWTIFMINIIAYSYYKIVDGQKALGDTFQKTYDLLDSTQPPDSNGS